MTQHAEFCATLAADQVGAACNCGAGGALPMSLLERVVRLEDAVLGLEARLGDAYAMLDTVLVRQASALAATAEPEPAALDWPAATARMRDGGSVRRRGWSRNAGLCECRDARAEGETRWDLMMVTSEDWREVVVRGWRPTLEESAARDWMPA